MSGMQTGRPRTRDGVCIGCHAPGGIQGPLDTPFTCAKQHMHVVPTNRAAPQGCSVLIFKLSSRFSDTLNPIVQSVTSSHMHALVNAGLF